MLSTHIHFRRVQWSKMIGVALPLAMATWLVSVNINLPRLFLARSSSESTLGLFAILCYTSIPATMLVSAIMQAATPRLASLHRDGHLSQYRRLLRILALTTAAIGVANWCAVHTLGQPVLQRILGAEYAGWNRQLDWITAASSLGYVAVVPATAISAQRLFRLSLLTNAVSCVVAVLASATLIPRMSMMGAAITMLLTSGVHCLVSLAALRLAATFPTQFKFPRSTWPRGRRAA